MSPSNHLRENLLSAEAVDPERQERFRSELAEIVEPRLPRSHRLYYILSALGPAVGLPGAICGAVFDAEHRWLWALFALACAAFVGWTVYILRRGAEPLAIMQGTSKALCGAAAVATGAVIYYGLENPSHAAVLWALAGLLVTLMTWFINLWNRVITAERTVREHLLRVEYRLADGARAVR